MRYFMRLAYNGTYFHGWQSQPNAVSVQQTIEESLFTLLRKEVKITGAGRTDTGVHAKEMFAHFDVDGLISNKEQFKGSLNSLMGNKIVVDEIKRVNDDAHARFDAISRTYKYFISYDKNPFLQNLAMFSHARFDMESMNEAASILKDTDDFTSFAKLHSDAKTNICQVTESSWKSLCENQEAYPGFFNGIVFTIKADRFLRNMVRAVVGTLLEVGRGKITIDDFDKIINKRDRCSAGTSVSPSGLYLWEVKYPSEIFID